MKRNERAYNSSPFSSRLLTFARAIAYPFPSKNYGVPFQNINATFTGRLKVTIRSTVHHYHTHAHLWIPQLSSATFPSYIFKIPCFLRSTLNTTTRSDTFKTKSSCNRLKSEVLLIKQEQVAILTCGTDRKGLIHQ